MSDWNSEVTQYGWAAEAVVHEDTGIVENVLICGPVSKNGYPIPDTAFDSEAHMKELYEGRHVYIDHAERGKELSRSVRELGGVFRNVRNVNGRPRGDIHTEGCREAATVLGAAKAKMTDLGMSHVARYKWGTSEGKRVVARVEEVASVDLVTRPATTRTFSEQTDPNGEPDMTTETVDALKELLNGEKTANQALRDQLSAVTAERDALKTEKAALASEKVALTAERDALKAEKDAAIRRESVLKAAKDAGLDTEKQCPAYLIEAWMGIESESARADAIKAHKELVGEASKGTGTNGTAHSQERHGGKPTDFDPSKINFN